MRNAVILVGLVIVLSAMVGLSQLTAEWHYIIPAAPEAVLYAATFDGLLEDWNLYEGRLSAQAEGGALHLKVGAPQSLPYSVATPFFADFNLHVQAMAVDGPLNNGFGVVFRLQDPQNFYAFLISSDGYYQVLRQVNGVQKELSTWIPSPVVAQGIGVENWLRVVAQGERFTFYVNGELVPVCVPDNPQAYSTYREETQECLGGQMRDTLVDDTISYGHLGVVAMTLDHPGVEVGFDNVLVWGS